MTALDAASLPPEFKHLVQQILALPQRHPSTSVTFGTGKLGSVTLRRSGSSVLSLFLDGRVETKPAEYLQKAFGGPGGQRLSDAIARLWGLDFVDGWKKPSATQVVQHGPELLRLIEEVLAQGSNSAPGTFPVTAGD